MDINKFMRTNMILKKRRKNLTIDQIPKKFITDMISELAFVVSTGDRCILVEDIKRYFKVKDYYPCV